jgi:uncharacterized protein YuzE
MKQTYINLDTCEIEELEVDNNGKIIEVEQEEKQEELKIHENQTEINF